MTVKAVFDIDLRGFDKFSAFGRLYDKYEKALKSTPAAWKLVQEKIDGSRSSFDKLVDSMAAANVQTKLREKAQERADQLTRTAADRWRTIARSTREVAGNIGAATTSLLKWASITGIVSGLIGAGGLFGIDRLALGVAQNRRSALGLGLGYGEQQAFSANFSRLVDPEAFLSGVAGAKFDITKRVGLIGAGLTPGQIAGDTAQTAVALLRNLKRIADTTSPALFAQVLQARQLGQFASPEDLERLRNTSPAEFNRLIGQYQQRSGQFDLPAGVAERWQDFVTQMSNAGRAIETTLVKGLVPLAPGLTKLSEAVSKVIESFLSSPALGRWIGEVDQALEQFAGYIGTDDFRQKAKSFVDGLGALGGAIARFIGWFGGGGGTGAGGHSNPRDRWAQSHLRATARGDYVPNPVGVWLGNEFSPGARAGAAALLPLIRASERSGDSSISPKGAVGRYQIEPSTARLYGYRSDIKSLMDPKYNEAVARAVLADLIRRYHGNTNEVLAAYNAGTRRGDAYAKSGDNLATLPGETQRYVTRARGLDGYSPTVITIENNTGGNAVVSTNGLKN